jgi:hypothetical protein
LLSAAGRPAVGGKRAGRSFYFLPNIMRFWYEVDTQTHRFLTNRFPFGVLYRIKDDHIRIIAVMHLRWKPDYWQSR